VQIGQRPAPAGRQPPSGASRRSASPQRRRWREKRAGRPPLGSSRGPRGVGTIVKQHSTQP
jgi:hypothetical protein